jgi:hypothetical protein
MFGKNFFGGLLYTLIYIVQLTTKHVVDAFRSFFTSYPFRSRKE